MQIIHHDLTFMGINIERLLLKKLKLLDVLDLGSLITYLIWFLARAIESENFVHEFTSAGDKFSHDAEIENVRQTRKWQILIHWKWNFGSLKESKLYYVRIN